MNGNDLIQFFKLDPPSQNDSPTSNIPIWNRGKVIGEGTFGTIWLETHSLDARMRAIKQVKRHETSLREKVNQELLAVTRMSRPKYMEHFAHQFGWYEEGPNLSLAMEFFEFGDLRKHMRPETPFPETQCRDIMQQLLTGLDVLHNDGFAHRDLKPENIFVLRPTPQWRVKIGDFGIAKRSWNGDTLLRSRTGTLPYMAPEIFQWVEGGDDDEFKYTQAVDVWSIGIMLFEFLVGQRPFRNETALKMYCDRKVKFPAGLLRNYVATFHGCQFVQELLSLDPRSRPSAIQSLSRPWFTDSAILGKQGPGTYALPEILTQNESESSRSIQSESVSEAGLQSRSLDVQPQFLEWSEKWSGDPLSSVSPFEAGELMPIAEDGNLGEAI